MNDDDRRFVQAAVEVLEKPSFIMKASAYLGRPISALTARIPDRIQGVIQRGVDKALTTGLRVAVASLNDADTKVAHGSEVKSRKWGHTAAAMGLGAVSGLTGGWALVLELPVTTTLMMRSIAAMAQGAGFDPADPQTALEILTVFAYGSPTARADVGSGDGTFYMQRAALDALVRDGAKFIAGKSAAQVLAAVENGAAPRLIELLARIASRMNLLVGEKFIAQSMPLLGAAGGAAINGMFNDYYSNIAYYAFGLKQLEKKYGQAAVREAYEAAARRQLSPSP
jgi:EcsC protein family